MPAPSAFSTATVEMVTAASPRLAATQLRTRGHRRQPRREHFLIGGNTLRASMLGQALRRLELQ